MTDPELRAATAEVGLRVIGLQHLLSLTATLTADLTSGGGPHVPIGPRYTRLVELSDATLQVANELKSRVAALRSAA